MSKIVCFNNTGLEEVFNKNKAAEQFEENAAVKTIKAEYESILAELNAIKEELGVSLEESKIVTSEIKFQIIGEKGAYRVEQYQQSLNQAKALDKQGISTSEIEKQTNWYKNEQGQWKYFSNEILNEFLDISQRRNETVNLRGLLKPNSVLLKAYPELNNVKVEFYEGTKGADFRGDARTNGTVTKEGEKITIHARTDQTDGGNSVSTIGHEVAHLLQSVEGFARGGNPNAFVKIASIIVGGNETDTEASLRDKVNTFDTSTLSKDEKNIIDIVRKVIKTNNTKLLIDNYFLLQGEIDARAVELALELKSKFGKTINFTYSDLIKELGRREGSDLVNEAINIYLDDITLSKSPQKIDTIQKVVDRLKQTGLAENVYQLSTEEINAKLEELGVSEDIRKQVGDEIIKRADLTPIADQTVQDILEYNQYYKSKQLFAKGAAREKTKEFIKNSKFNTQTNSILSLGVPSEILKAVGISNTPITIPFKYFQEHLLENKGHNMTAKEVAEVMRAIHNPLAIYKNSENQEYARNNRYEILTPLKNKDGENIIVILEVGRVVRTKGDMFGK